MPRQAREQFVLNLLEQNWDGSNTFNETPSIIYGRDQAPTKPFVVVEQPDEGPVGGGTTTFDGIDSTGGVPHQTISGTVPVHLFASDKELDNADTQSGKVYLTGTTTQSGDTLTVDAGDTYTVASGDTEYYASITVNGTLTVEGTLVVGTDEIQGGAIEEVLRIIRNNAVRPSDPKTGNQPVELLSAGPFNEVPEPEEAGTYHYQGSINYLYWTA